MNLLLIIIIAALSAIAIISWSVVIMAAVFGLGPMARRYREWFCKDPEQ